jgi:hypothetical protein
LNRCPWLEVKKSQMYWLVMMILASLCICSHTIGSGDSVYQKCIKYQSACICHWELPKIIFRPCPQRWVMSHLDWSSSFFLISIDKALYSINSAQEQIFAIFRYINISWLMFDGIVFYL